MKLEIQKILFCSTAHISKETAIFLTSICNFTKESELIVYPKKDIAGYHGWFVCCDCYDDLELLDIPEDLMKLLIYASDLNVNWICLDQSANVINSEYLDFYEWYGL